jgi:hypothetical protein
MMCRQQVEKCQGAPLAMYYILQTKIFVISPHNNLPAVRALPVITCIAMTKIVLVTGCSLGGIGFALQVFLLDVIA